MNELWNIFTQSGKVEDYLIYKQKEDKTQEVPNADNGQRLDNKGTDDRGE